MQEVDTMARLTANDLIKAYGGDNPPQLLFLCGEDTLAVAQLEKRILKKLTDGDALSHTVFDGNAPDLDRLADACSFCPMFQPYNVIVIRDLLPASLPPSGMDTLKGILGELAPRVVVLIVMRAVQVYEVKRGNPVFTDKYAKFVTFCEKQGAVCVCEKKNAIMLGKSIQERAKRHGSDISREDAEELANRCLCDSTLIHTELDKLLACADGGPITTEMLRALTAALPDADVYRMARAVTSGRAAEAFRLLDALTAKAEDTKTVLGLLSILSGTFLDLYRAKLGMGAGRQEEAIAADFAYKNRAFAVRNAMKDCRSMTVPQLRTCVRILRETDRSCKSARVAPRLLLEQAIVRMLRVGRDGTEAMQ